MNASPTLLAVRNNARRMARSLTALQLYCHSNTYAQRLPELVKVLATIARQIDELEVVSASTLYNALIEQTNRYTTFLLALLAANPNTLTAAELGHMLTPAIRLLTEAEHQAWGAEA